MYDDHLYCGTCDKHSVACYCFTYVPPEEDGAPADLVCVEHDPIWGGPLTSLPAALWDTRGILPQN